MSVEAITWALNLAPVPVDKKGQPNTACAVVLLGLANHAGPDGTGAFPAARTLARYTRLSVRSVRTALDRLEAAGVIRPCDPAIVAARIKRADRRPQGWDLDIRLIRDDLTDDDLHDLERIYPGITERFAAAQEAGKLGVPALWTDDVKPLHPAGNAPESPVDNSDHEVKPVHPVEPNGVKLFPHGVKPLPPRGETASPEPSLNRPEPPPPPARDEAPVENQAAEDDPCLKEFFDGLGQAWHLSPSQRGRLAAAVRDALARGWEPRALAAHVGANSSGVRSPYAVLRTRLSPDEVPAPPTPTGTRSSAPPVSVAAAVPDADPDDPAAYIAALRGSRRLASRGRTAGKPRPHEPGTGRRAAAR